MAGTMRPIPDVEGAPFIACPLPFVGQSRLDQAHAIIRAAFEAGIAPDRRGLALQVVVSNSLQFSVHGPWDRTALEVVAWYALLQGMPLPPEEVGADCEEAAKRVVWLAVWAG